jgi:hypothetical protein
LDKTSFEALIDVIQVLQTLEIPYMLVGAFSSNVYGYPRATKDADIVIDYREGILSKICATLGNNFKLDPQTGFEMITGSIRNIITYSPTKFEIELFRLGNDPHHQERFARGVAFLSQTCKSKRSFQLQRMLSSKSCDGNATKTLQTFELLSRSKLRAWTGLTSNDGPSNMVQLSC